MKILMVETGGWGGITHYTYNLLEGLARARKQSSLSLLTNYAYELRDKPRHFALLETHIRDSHYLKGVSLIAKAVSREKPDLVHIQSVISARKDWVFFVLARVFGIRLVYTAHNILPHEESERNAFGLKFSFAMIYRFSNAIIVHSNFAREELIRTFRVDPGKIRVIDHGNYLFADTGSFDKRRSRESLGIDPDAKVMLHFGAIREYKGIDELLYAFAAVVKGLPEAVLMIVGPALEKKTPERCRMLIKKLGLEAKVVLKEGYVPLDEVPLYFSCCDAAVFPYRRIYSSGALHLAYAFSKPVIAFATGALKESIEDGNNGLLVEPNDIGGLSMAMSRLLREDELRGRMGKASFELAVTRFSWDRIGEETMKFYSELS